MSSHRGPATGGGTVVVHGRHLDQVRHVRFGSHAARIVRHLSNYRLVVRVPARRSGYDTGWVFVRVSGPGGESGAVAGSRYHFVEPAPVITSLSRHTGDTVNPYAVVIYGRYLGQEDGITFGTTRVIGRLSDSDTAVKISPGAHAPGSVNVRVHTPSGWSATGPQTTYTYILAPRITGILHDSGPTTGGGEMLIHTLGVDSDTQVLMGGSPVAVVDRRDDDLFVRIPAHSPGLVNVQLVTPTTVSAAVRAAQYRYGPPSTQALSEPAAIDPQDERTLDNISCSADAFCMAVDNNGRYATRTDGVWSAISPPQANPVGNLGLSCPSATFCMAVDSAAAWTWDGQQWTALPTPVETPTVDLSRVECPSASFCLTDDRGYLRTWTANAGWQNRVRPVTYDAITAISCWADDECAATGDTNTLYFLRDGDWSDGAGSWIGTHVDRGNWVSSLDCSDYDHCVSGTTDGEVVTGTTPSATVVANVLPGYIAQIDCVTSDSCFAWTSVATATFDGQYWSAPAAVPGLATAVSCTGVKRCVLTTQHDAYDVTW